MFGIREVLDTAYRKITDKHKHTGQEVECYPAQSSWNYNDSLLFHGGDTGSTPVRDANKTPVAEKAHGSN